MGQRFPVGGVHNLYVSGLNYPAVLHRHLGAHLGECNLGMNAAADPKVSKAGLRCHRSQRLRALLRVVSLLKGDLAAQSTILCFPQ